MAVSILKKFSIFDKKVSRAKPEHVEAKSEQVRSRGGHVRARGGHAATPGRTDHPIVKPTVNAAPLEQQSFEELCIQIVKWLMSKDFFHDAARIVHLTQDSELIEAFDFRLALIKELSNPDDEPKPMVKIIQSLKAKKNNPYILNLFKYEITGTSLQDKSNICASLISKGFFLAAQKFDNTCVYRSEYIKFLETGIQKKEKRIQEQGKAASADDVKTTILGDIDQSVLFNGFNKNENLTKEILNFEPTSNLDEYLLKRGEAIPDWYDFSILNEEISRKFESSETYFFLR
jgi:hypothetical protein